MNQLRKEIEEILRKLQASALYDPVTDLPVIPKGRTTGYADLIITLFEAQRRRDLEEIWKDIKNIEGLEDEWFTNLDNYFKSKLSSNK